MNPFERQAKIQQDLYEIGTSTWQQLSELDNESRTKYQAMNEEFAQKLPEFGDINGWTEVQRQYGEAMWSSLQDYMNARGDIIKGAFTQTNEIVKSAFAPEEPVKAKATRAKAA